MVFITKYRKNSQIKKQEYRKNIIAIIWDILKDKDFESLLKFKHHLFFNRYEHLINVARIAHRLAKWLNADIHSCTLAWILHDFHNTHVKWHLHAIIAANNARKFKVNEKVLHIIRCHMYPFGRNKIKRFKWIDFWIVKVADFSAMCYEVFHSILFLSFKWKDIIKLKKNRLLIEELTKY